jgi:PKHD-type hydroxylase
MSYTTIYNDPYSRAKFIEPWVYWDDAFSEEELEKIVMYCESFDLDYGSTFGAKSKEESEKFRISSVKFHQRNEDTAWIFDRLNLVIQSVNEKFYNFDLNGYYQFQYTRYDADKNGHYQWHMDMAMGSKDYLSDIEHRKLSITVMLNDSFKGGDFCINSGLEENAEIVPFKKGRIVLFPSFMIHKVNPITSGTRRSLVVWVLGPKFK